MSNIEGFSEVVSSDDEQEQTMTDGDEAGFDDFTNAFEQETDFLPQPYRLIDKIVKFLVARAVTTVDGKGGQQGGQDSNENLPVCLPSNPGVLATIPTRDTPSVDPFQARTRLNSPGSGPGLNAALGHLTAFELTPDGKMAFAGTQDGKIHVISLAPANFDYVTSATIGGLGSGGAITTLSLSATDFMLGDEEVYISSYRVAWGSGSELGVFTVDVDAWVCSQGCSMTFPPKSTVDEVAIAAGNYYLAVTFTDGRFDVYHLSLKNLNPVALESETDRKRKESTATGSLALSVPSAKSGAMPPPAPVEKGRRRSIERRRSMERLKHLTPVANEKLTLLCQPVLSALPPPEVVPAAPAPAAGDADGKEAGAAGEVAGVEATIKAHVHFLTVMEERRIGMPTVYSARGLLLWWEGDVTMHRYALSRGSRFVAVDPIGKSLPPTGGAATKGGKKAEEVVEESAGPGLGPTVDPEYTWYLPDFITCSAVDASTTLLAVGLASGAVVVYDNNLVCEKMILTPHADRVEAVCFSVGQYLLVSSGRDRTLHTHVVGRPKASPLTSEDPVELGAVIRSDTLPKMVKSIHCLRTVELAVCGLEGEAGSMLLYDVVSANVIARFASVLPKAGLAQQGTGEALRFGKVQGIGTSGDLVLGLIEGKSSSPKASTEANTEASTEAAEAQTSTENATDTRLAVYGLGDLVCAAYPAIAGACPSAYQRRSHAKEMFKSTSHEKRFEPDTFKNFSQVPAGLQSLVVQIDGPTSRLSTRGNSRSGWRDRSDDSRRGSKGRLSKRGPSQASARDSEWSVRSDADSEYGQNHQEEGQDSKEELEDPSPYNDLSKHIFAQLKEREATRRERDRRSAARKIQLREQLQTEQNELQRIQKRH